MHDLLAADWRYRSCMPPRRPPILRRSWLFLPGADSAAQKAGAASGADVLIQELEDFTPADRRPEARAAAARLYDVWRTRGAVAAVRINPLETVGREDLAAVMVGRPDVVLMSKVSDPGQVTALAAESTGTSGRWESPRGRPNSHLTSSQPAASCRPTRLPRRTRV